MYQIISPYTGGMLVLKFDSEAYHMFNLNVLVSSQITTLSENSITAFLGLTFPKLKKG